MNTRLVKLSGIAVAAMLSTALMSDAALAQGRGPLQQPAAACHAGGRTGGMMMRGQMGGAEDSLVAIAAKELGVTQVDLVALLKAGKTFADVAKDKNVDLAKIVDAFVAEKAADRQTMVANGRWTQAQLETMTAMMKATITQKLSQPFTVQGDGTCDGRPASPMQRRGPGRWNT
jgi:hypothetical protein